MASILDQIGVDFGPPGAVREISRNWARIVAGARFEVPGMPKTLPKASENPHRPATWLQERLGRLLARFYINFAFILASIFDSKIVLKSVRKSKKHGFDFRTLEGVSSTSGRSECARCVKRSRLGAVAWQGLAQRRSASQTRSSHRKRWSADCMRFACPADPNGHVMSPRNFLP